MPVVRTDGRCTVKLPNFLGWVVYHTFLPMVLRYNYEIKLQSQLNMAIMIVE